MQNQIEGVVEPGQSVVVIEHLVSTGKSRLLAVEALREAGAVVKGMVAIFTYLLEVAARNFAEANVELHTLTDYDALIQVACEQDYVMDKELESLKTWRQNPELWSDQHMES